MAGYRSEKRSLLANPIHGNYGFLRVTITARNRFGTLNCRMNRWHAGKELQKEITTTDFCLLVLVLPI